MENKSVGTYAPKFIEGLDANLARIVTESIAGLHGICMTEEMKPIINKDPFAITGEKLKQQVHTMLPDNILMEYFRTNL
jgi:hypothetical protein